MQSPQCFEGRPTVENVILLASDSRTESGNGDPVVLDGFGMFLFQLEVTSTIGASSDAMDVYLQTTIDGSTWLNAYRFAGLTGDSVNALDTDIDHYRAIVKIVYRPATDEFDSSDYFDSGILRNLIGSQWRVRWDVSGSEDDPPTFIFSVTANLT